MNFTSNGIGRKNGFRFEMRYGSYLEGKEQENKWFLFCSRPIGKQIYNEGVYTEHSFRFPTQEAAMAFCEKVAAGEVTLQQIREKEDLALAARKDEKYREAEKKVDAFMEKMSELGVNPALAPEIVKAYHAMHDSFDLAFEIFEERIKDQPLQPEATPETKKEITLGEYMQVYQKDIDICLVDNDTGEHHLPALCFLGPEDLSSGELSYEPYEQWLMTLPLEKISGSKDCPLAVVKTEFSLDQTNFLLGEGGYETYKWSNLYILAEWAGAEFEDRLAYLTDGKPFEKPFDGTCMDVLNPTERSKLYSMLIENTNLFVTTYPGKDDEFYAYSYHFYANGRPISDQEIDIKMTEPGKGLANTLDGKVYWNSHLAAKAREEKLNQSPGKGNQQRGNER